MLIALCAGILTGIALAKLFYPKPVGYLRVDHSDTEPYLFLELSSELGSSILSKKYIVLEIKKENYISQK